MTTRHSGIPTRRKRTEGHPRIGCRLQKRSTEYSRPMKSAPNSPRARPDLQHTHQLETRSPEEAPEEAPQDARAEVELTQKLMRATAPVARSPSPGSRRQVARARWRSRQLVFPSALSRQYGGIVAVDSESVKVGGATTRLRAHLQLVATKEVPGSAAQPI